MLNLAADKVYDNVVENVHFLNDVGLADVTPEAAARFIEKCEGTPLDSARKSSLTEHGTLILDSESLWTTLEGTPAYTTLADVIAKGRIDTSLEKVWLACLIIDHQFRTPSAFEAFAHAAEACGMERFEALIYVKQLFSATHPFMVDSAAALADAQWIVYRTPDHTFPLSDAAFLFRPGSILFACSPRMLIEIHPRHRVPPPGVIYKDDVPRSKLREYRARCLEKTTKEIIFHDSNVLEDWRASPECRVRIGRLRAGVCVTRISA